MADKYILDACALLALVYRETGDDVVKSTLDLANSNKADVYMHVINFYEAYYDIVRSKGLQQADAVFDMLLKSPVRIIDGISASFCVAARGATQSTV